MINERIFNQIKPIISDPGWGLIVQRIEEHFNYADKKVHQATRDTIDYAKGYYDSALFIYRLLSEPKNIASDGVTSLATPSEEKEE
jgi:hypothetical protein